MTKVTFVPEDPDNPYPMKFPLNVSAVPRMSRSTGVPGSSAFQKAIIYVNIVLDIEFGNSIKSISVTIS